jgi:hypothetical protein
MGARTSMAQPALLRLKRRVGGPTAGQTFAYGEPILDASALRPRLYAGGADGSPLLISDMGAFYDLQSQVGILEVRVNTLELMYANQNARIRQLEAALRELQYLAWTGTPTFPIVVGP